MHETKPDLQEGNHEEYVSWLARKAEISFDVNLELRLKEYYNTVADRMLKTFNDSPYWTRLRRDIQEFNAEYFESKGGYNLLMPPTSSSPLSLPGKSTSLTGDLVIKPWESFLLKTYRTNVLNNRQWPDPPARGWVLPPESWFAQVNDVIRTLLVVKYMDGVEFLGNKLISLSKELHLIGKGGLEARDDGYYAYHFYLQYPFEVSAMSWDTLKFVGQVEIHITTQLQEAVRGLLHRRYEGRRRSDVLHQTDWQWKYRSQDFSSNYLGHILHYIEGLIMVIREHESDEEGTAR